MFVPLHDSNPLESIRFQYVTFLLIAANVAVFVLFQSGLVYPANISVASSFAVVPGQLFAEGLMGPLETSLQHDAFRLPESLTLVTYMFLHGGWMHLIGNMLFLWVFGDNVEDAMGHMRFLVFYLLCGIFAGLAHSYMLPESQLPLVGASGAVAGVIAAYLLLHPNVKVWVLVLMRFPVRLAAGWVLGAWAVLQFVNVYMSQGDNVAWWAHIGGMFAGAVLIVFMRRPGIALFDRKAGGTS